jgi:flagellar basal body P-ring protein FlgI
MRKRTLGVVLLAGLAMSGAGAFTAANPMNQTSNIAGYGQAVATGATVTDIAYTTLTSDHSKLTQVVFTTSTDLSLGKTAKMVLKDGTGAVLGSYNCTIGAFVLASGPITCATADNPEVASIAQTGLTVVDS